MYYCDKIKAQVKVGKVFNYCMPQTCGCLAKHTRSGKKFFIYGLGWKTICK